MVRNVFFTLLLTCLTSSILFSQAPPQGITYQAVVYSDISSQNPGYDLSGQVLKNTEIGVRFSIISGTATGTIVYQEEHNTETDQYGLFTLIIGQGNQVVTQSFNVIDWGSGYHFLKVEIDKSGGSNFKDMGTQQMWSVPYALYTKYAEIAGNGIDNIVDNGDGTITFNYTDGTSYTTGPLGASGPIGPTGADGQDGDSAYEIWLSLGNTGTETDFITALTGQQGIEGENGKNSLIKTTNEPAGVNCSNGGVKIEAGLDENMNGILDLNEIDDAQTSYVCSPSIDLSGGLTNYYTVNTLHNGFAGSIQAEGYYAATNTTITQEFTDLNAKEFQFIMIQATHRCFSVGANFTFYDSLDNELSAMFDDRRTWQVYDPSWDWTTQPIDRDFGSTSALVISSTIDNSAGGSTMRVIERAIRIVPSGVVRRVVVTFNTTDVYTTTCLNCTCKDAYYSPGPNPYGGFSGNVSYKLFSFE
jgi:hypothetical protein